MNARSELAWTPSRGALACALVTLIGSLTGACSTAAPTLFASDRGSASVYQVNTFTGVGSGHRRTKVLVPGVGQTAVLQGLAATQGGLRVYGTSGGIIYEVVLCLRRGKREEIRRGTAEIMKRKRRSQPYGQSSAGCIFRNPEGDSAGRLIESAGLKGERIGGAMVSMLHANFIVNDGDATSSDVFRLIERVQQAVRIRFGVSLELEVRVI